MEGLDGRPDLSYDVSQGRESHTIPLISPTIEQVTLLQRSFTYIADSILPDLTPISATRPSARDPADTVPSDDEASSGEDEGWGCGCANSVSTCSAAQGDECDCVSNFGNFYIEGETGQTVLLLDALPERLPLVECGQECNCTATCTNRLTQKGIQTCVSVKCTQAGLGAFYSLGNNEILPPGSFISLYAGEYLDTTEARSRWSKGYSDNYILSLRISGEELHIDPRHYGNYGRFLNHSCDPNCVIQILRWGGGDTWSRAAIFTKRVVSPGEELTFDYGNASGTSVPLDPRQRVTDPKEQGELWRTKCLCGAPTCRGYMPFDDTL